MISGHFSVLDDSLQFALAHGAHQSFFFMESPFAKALVVYEGRADLLETPETPLSTASYEQKKNTCLSSPYQVLLIEWCKTPEPELHITRNGSATCPLYLLDKGEQIFLHWDPIQLYPLLDRQTLLNEEQCLAFLSGTWRHDSLTLFRDLYLLPDRVKVRIAPQHFTIERPVPVQDYATKQVTSPQIVFETLDQILSEDLGIYGLEKSTAPIYCELSSGLDTTLVAHRLVEKFGKHRVTTAGYVPLGADRPKIIARRQETVHRLQTQDDCPPIESYFASAWQLGEPLWPYQAPTLFEKAGLAKRIAAAGSDIIFSGIGGDELCRLSPDERATLPPAPQRFSAPLPFKNLLTETADQNFDPKAIAAWPVGIMPRSAHAVAHCIAPAYLRQGIWYAHPLTSRPLQMFSHSLPLEWRQGRFLSKEALRRRGASPAFLEQTPKESLSESLDQLMLTLPHFDKIFASSVLADLGYLDLEKLTLAKEILETTGEARFGYHVLLALSLELALKHLV